MIYKTIYLNDGTKYSEFKSRVNLLYYLGALTLATCKADNFKCLL